MCAFEIQNHVSAEEYLKPRADLPPSERTVKRFVYVISNYDGIVAIFSDKGVADEYANRTGEDGPDEYEIDTPLPDLVHGKYAWHVELLCKDGSVSRCYNESVIGKTGEIRSGFDTRADANAHHFAISLLAESKEKAIELARAEFDKAGGLGHMVKPRPPGPGEFAITKEAIMNDATGVFMDIAAATSRKILENMGQ